MRFFTIRLKYAQNNCAVHILSLKPDIQQRRWLVHHIQCIRDRFPRFYRASQPLLFASLIERFTGRHLLEHPVFLIPVIMLQHIVRLIDRSIKHWVPRLPCDVPAVVFPLVAGPGRVVFGVVGSGGQPFRPSEAFSKSVGI